MKKLSRFLAVGLLAAAIQAQAAYDIRTGLLSYYPFDTSTTKDTAYTNDFSAVASPTLVPGQRGTTALQLNGTSQYLRLDHSPDNSINGFPVFRAGAYSVTFWVKAPAQVNRYVYAEGNSTNAGASSTVGLFLLQTGAAASSSKLDVFIRTDGNSTPVNHRVSTATVFDDTWHHVAWVDNNGIAQLYVDGVLDATDFNYSRSGSFSFDRAAIGALVRNTIGGFLGGTIDDFSLWERPLTQAEVQNIKNNGISVPVPTLPPALVVEPVSQTKGHLDAVTFSTTVYGTRPNTAISYQWNKNNSPITDATNRTLRIMNLTTANSGEQYSVTVSNAVSGVTSSNATLTVLADGPVDLRDGLVSHWPMNAISNNVGELSTIDLYSRNDLILSNFTEFDLDTGVFGNALFFIDPQAYAVRSSGTPIYQTDGYSVAMWVKADGGSQADRRVYSEASSTNNGTLFTIGTANPANPSGIAQILIRDNSNRNLVARSSTRPVFDGNWHHIAWVDVGGQTKLYVDGVVDETDFNYTPSTLTPNVTSVGSVVRAGLVANTSIFGTIDDAVTFDRPLTHADVQEMINLGIPAPLAATPPTIVEQPTGADVFTKADVTFDVTVTGTGPFTYTWRNGANLVASGPDPFLHLSNIQLSDAGSYSVEITGPGGTTNSAPAVLNVTTRPAPPALFALDFNNRGQEGDLTENGFQSFVLDYAGATALPTVRLYGGVEVVVVGSAGTTIDSRNRGTPVNSGEFTQTKLLQDFIFSTPAAGTDGLDVHVKFLQPNQQYVLTIWSYDTGVAAGDRVSDWYVNDNLIRDNYLFVAANTPTNNAQYQSTYLVMSDSNGHLLIQGRRDLASASGASVFLNALRIAPTTAPSIEGHPRSRDVYVNESVTFTVAASGVEPITYQWFKGNDEIFGETGSTLSLSNVQLSDNGSYRVAVSNEFGVTNSQSAQLIVSERPAPQISLGIDFNHRNVEGEVVLTEDKFESFTLDGTGAIDVPTTRTFGGVGGVEVTVAGSNGTTADSRVRTRPGSFGDLTIGELLRDFIFSPPATGTDGLDVTLKFLTPNRPYSVTVWSFDADNAGPRFSDWYANGVLVQNDYAFDGTLLPTNDVQYHFTFETVSDSEGTIVLQGRREASGTGVAVFLNALKLEVGMPQLVISQVERIGGNLRLTVQTPDSSLPYSVTGTAELSQAFGPVNGVTKTILSPTSIQFDFAAPQADAYFYQVNLNTP